MPLPFHRVKTGYVSNKEKQAKPFTSVSDSNIATTVAVVDKCLAAMATETLPFTAQRSLAQLV